MPPRLVTGFNLCAEGDALNPPLDDTELLRVCADDAPMSVGAVCEKAGLILTIRPGPWNCSAAGVRCGANTLQSGVAIHFAKIVFLYRANSKNRRYFETMSAHGSTRVKWPHRRFSSSACIMIPKSSRSSWLRGVSCSSKTFRRFNGSEELRRSLALRFSSTSSAVLFLSKGVTPTMWNVSVMSIVLIHLSSGEDDASEHDTLTSMSHGFSVLSSSTSKPKISKQEARPLQKAFILETTECSTEMIVFTTRSCMRSRSDPTSTPLLCKCFHKAVSDHLEPSPSLAASELRSKFSDFLFTE
mmetsp:Transcript_10992/g.36463  ORF Transcript_10992/g.36463 Transcript_10992/m.36463 type:complete len:300 (+) Transcript_10992:571-1470(+)|eukprot:scaffold27484_cov120-Isochrysis_galbana.AAC.6